MVHVPMIAHAVCYDILRRKKGAEDMPNYAKMYRKLFNAQTDAIALLQAAQQETEKLYIEADDTPIELLTKDDLQKDDE